MRTHLDQAGPTLHVVDSTGRVKIRLSSDRRQFTVFLDDVCILSCRQASPVAAELSINFTLEGPDD